MFSDNIEPKISNILETIGGKYIIPEGIGTFSWSWTDDGGQLHTKKLNNVIYFTNSTFKILSETALPESMKDDDGT